MDGQIEGEPVVQEERTVQQQHTTGRQFDIRAAGRAVGDRVPQVGQHPAAAAGAQRVEHLAPQGAGVVPAAVVGLQVLVAVLQPDRGGAQEALRADDQAGAASDAQRLGDPFGEVARAGGRGAVEGDTGPWRAVGRVEVQKAFGEQVDEPVPGDRFESHTAMMRHVLGGTGSAGEGRAPRTAGGCGRSRMGARRSAMARRGGGALTDGGVTGGGAGGRERVPAGRRG